jgi:hypothetical protein
VTSIDPAPIEAWEPWTPAELATRLAKTNVHWCVVGGWSIDLHLGRVTRDHEDLEFAVLRHDDLAVRAALSDLEPFSPGETAMIHLPDGAARPCDSHQTWMLDPVARAWRVDVMIEPGDADTWVYRRDESFTAPRAFMERRTADAIPYLGPHGSLFFKAKHGRPKDQADFDLAAPTLTHDERAWLIDAIDRFHPGHPWIDELRKPEDVAV